MSIKTKSVVRGSAIAILCTAVFAGCSLIPKEEEPLKPPLVKPVQENYVLAEVKTGNIVKKVSGVAYFESTEMSIHEFTGVTGRIKEVHVQQRDIVKAGDPLITLEPGDSAIVLKERERDYEQALYNLDQAKLTQDPAKVKIRLMELEIAKIKLEDARHAVEGKILRAKQDGVVTFVEKVKIGDSVSANKSYVNIANPNSIRLAYSGINVADMLEVQIGMKVDVTYKGKTYEGTVVQSPSNAPPTDNRQLSEQYAKTIYIQLKEMPEDATLGETADISIVTREKENVLLVPPRAVSQYLGRSYVRILEGQSVKEVDVERGLETNTEVEIVKGLKEGQQVILN